MAEHLKSISAPKALDDFSTWVQMDRWITVGVGHVSGPGGPALTVVLGFVVVVAAPWLGRHQGEDPLHSDRGTARGREALL